ncbi:hypothetical protein IL306_001245 [Fusarium sp. DS 682]|nr:hypothetical protein IL306_001245 [Fusarium sp. DS 682]
METPSGSNEPPKIGNDVTTFAIGLVTMGSKPRATKSRIGAMVVGSVVAGIGGTGLEKLSIDVFMLAKGLSTTLNMEYSNVDAMNPFEG